MAYVTPSVARPGEELVHDGHRVTHRPGARAYHQGQHAVLDRDRLAPADLREVLAQGAGRHQPEGVVVRTRPDRPDDLLGLGRGEDELQMLRRLLDDLQQGVEARRGDHVGLVDDVDLVAAARRAEERLLAQLTGVVHATVRRRVDLDHIDRPAAVAREVHTGLAGPARRGSGTLLTVQAARQDPRTGRLAAATRPAEQIGVVDAVVPQRLLQRIGHVLLPDDLGEGLGSVAAVQRKGRHAYDDIGPPTSGRPAPTPRPADPDPQTQAPPTHPPEPTYPCCLPALGEFSEIAPREGLRTTVADSPPGKRPRPRPAPSRTPTRAPAPDHVREHSPTSCIVCGGGFA